MNKIRYNIDMPLELHAALSDVAVRHGTKLVDVIKMFLAFGLALESVKDEHELRLLVEDENGVRQISMIY